MQSTIEYHKLLQKIFDNGRFKGDRTGTGTVSIFSHTLELDMNQGFPMITTKKMFTKGIIVELLWFLNGSKDIRELWKHNVKIWDGNWYDRYSKSCSSPYSLEEMKEKVDDPHIDPSVWSLGPIYGKQWVDWTVPNYSVEHVEYGEPNQYNINQIQEVVDKLINKPDDRRIMVTAWNPAEIKDMALPPCHWAFELYTEELTFNERMKIFNPTGAPMGAMVYNHAFLDDYDIPKRRLDLKWHQRSVDTGLGLPFNIASYALLLHMFAQQANMVPGKLIGDLTNVHIYKDHIEPLREQLTRDTSMYKSPSLKLNRANDMFSYQLEDFKIEGYESYPSIEMAMSV